MKEKIKETLPKRILALVLMVAMAVTLIPGVSMVVKAESITHTSPDCTIGFNSDEGGWICGNEEHNTISITHVIKANVTINTTGVFLDGNQMSSGDTLQNDVVVANDNAAGHQLFLNTIPNTADWPTSVNHSGCSHPGVEHFYATGGTYIIDYPSNAVFSFGRKFPVSGSYVDDYGNQANGINTSTRFVDFDSSGPGWYYHNGSKYEKCESITPLTEAEVIAKVDLMSSHLVAPQGENMPLDIGIFSALGLNPYDDEILYKYKDKTFGELLKELGTTEFNAESAPVYTVKWTAKSPGTLVTTFTITVGSGNKISSVEVKSNAGDFTSPSAFTPEALNDGVTPDYTSDANKKMEYKKQDPDGIFTYGYDFKGYVHDAWRGITYQNGGFKADVFEGEGLIVSATNKEFIASGQAIKMTYRVSNNTGAAVDNYRFYIAGDTAIAGNDASTNSIYKEKVVVMTDERRKVSAFAYSATEGGTAVPTEYAYDDSPDIDFLKVADEGADPSKVYYADKFSGDDDSAFVMFFPLHSLSNGEYKDYTFIIGIGDKDSIGDIIDAASLEAEPVAYTRPQSRPSSNTPSGPVHRPGSSNNNTAPGTTVPVSGEGTSNVTAEVSGNNATVSINSSAINNAAGNTSQDKTDTITVDLSGLKETVSSITISKTDATNLANALNSAANNKQYVEFKMAEYTVKVDATAMNAVVKAANGSDLRLVVETTAPAAKLNSNQKSEIANKEVARTFEAYFVSNGTRIGNFDGGMVQVGVVKFSVPSGKNSKNYHIEYLPESGKAERLKTRYVNGNLIFKTTHFSDYAIVYDEKAVNDTGVLAYRLYDKNRGEHIYTISRAERDMLVNAGWIDETTADGKNTFYASPEKTDIYDTAVYRSYNPYKADPMKSAHMYTKDKREYDKNVRDGWEKDAGIVFYVAGSAAGGENKIVYRAYNPNSPSGEHQWTVSKRELDALVKESWSDETKGNAWYSPKF